MRTFNFDARDFAQFQQVAETMAERLGDIFNEVGKEVKREQYTHRNDQTGKIRFDFAEDGQNVYIYADLPGVKKEDVSVTVNDENILTIRAEKKRPEAQANFIRTERKYGTFSRSIHIESEIERERISAAFTDGVLLVTLPKLTPVQAKEYKVNIQ
jgi:HSP20 family protein